ncbi:hypothetical protein EQG49_12475 [Periweissella cryptocerci]|uniref:Uncharacterized protein n=1 Tax=Periweissella cryptocerci TaxID=2506420 RepID=A0A4P6YWH6_9LACO|nr:hypothetical protein [Periweissella cryptocerci]QBO37212.1 hypothetical protein EQG49_12475 [Periweissella cryptocerci]
MSINKFIFLKRYRSMSDQELGLQIVENGQKICGEIRILFYELRKQREVLTRYKNGYILYVPLTASNYSNGTLYEISSIFENGHKILVNLSASKVPKNVWEVQQALTTIINSPQFNFGEDVKACFEKLSTDYKLGSTSRADNINNAHKLLILMHQYERFVPIFQYAETILWKMILTVGG